MGEGSCWGSASAASVTSLPPAASAAGHRSWLTVCRRPSSLLLRPPPSPESSRTAPARSLPMNGRSSANRPCACSRSARLLGQGWATVVPVPEGPAPATRCSAPRGTPSVTIVCSDPSTFCSTRLLLFSSVTERSRGARKEGPLDSGPVLPASHRGSRSWCPLLCRPSMWLMRFAVHAVAWAIPMRSVQLGPWRPDWRRAFHSPIPWVDALPPSPPPPGVLASSPEPASEAASEAAAADSASASKSGSAPEMSTYLTTIDQSTPRSISSSSCLRSSMADCV
mmetsp:Transcript_17192/g.51421  ORF Transcript_17192/g.51421 Transcript_17192/m.51421 type:complete len:281 (-) Transcript_17192:1810-2652(-)